MFLCLVLNLWPPSACGFALCDLCCLGFGFVVVVNFVACVVMFGSLDFGVVYIVCIAVWLFACWYLLVCFCGYTFICQVLGLFGF